MAVLVSGQISGPNYNNYLPIFFFFKTPACTCPCHLTQYLCLMSLRSAPPFQLSFTGKPFNKCSDVWIHDFLLSIQMHSVFTYFISSLWKSLFDRYWMFVIMHYIYCISLCASSWLPLIACFCRPSTAALWRQGYVTGWEGRAGERKVKGSGKGDLSTQKLHHVGSSGWMGCRRIWK